MVCTLHAGWDEAATGGGKGAQVPHKSLGQQVVCRDRGIIGHPGEGLQYEVADEEVSSPPLGRPFRYVLTSSAPLNAVQRMR